MTANSLIFKHSFIFTFVTFIIQFINVRRIQLIRSIQEEESLFRKSMNAAFRRFDVYGTGMGAEEEGKAQGEGEDAEDEGFILLEDAPDALVACGLPIEREEAENLVIDLASNSLSSEFQGFTKAEFELVCRRILSIFQQESDDVFRSTTSRSSRK